MIYPLLSSIVGKPADTQWGNVNLDSLARREDFASEEVNRLLDPWICDKWVTNQATRLGVQYTFGGHFEDRSHLWRGSYLTPDNSIHLGIDVNVPIGTPVHCPRDFIILQLHMDESVNYGWGGRIVVKIMGSAWLLFAHLDPESMQHLKIGAFYKGGTKIGETAIPMFNGGWYPHLHLQGLGKASLLDGALDGYGTKDEADAGLYPNPLEILSL